MPIGSEEKATEITALLNEARAGNAKAADLAMAAVYSRLRAMAGGCFAHERRGHTWQATALLNEAYIRIAAGADVVWKNREHFLGACANQMIWALRDYGRSHNAARRRCGVRAAFDDCHMSPERDREIEPIKDLLRRLKHADPVAAHVVQLRFFAGMTDEEVARKLGCSVSTVRRHWSFARAWLRRKLAELAER